MSQYFCQHTTDWAPEILLKMTGETPDIRSNQSGPRVFAEFSQSVPRVLPERSGSVPVVFPRVGSDQIGQIKNRRPSHVYYFFSAIFSFDRSLAGNQW